ncbi:hypothetical protein CL1_0348 [Thermococcus cleftensis]|uniref:Uncharacterized protein n=1 Tax=Thermococcus cleftensis (strain DSM 27260 / KACC 17922 / CL1) TaxID=163003 RepID=I3ZS75_THECF|nr:hypothetical protein [Thermococcus cleftensis]AFL94559.1 hypothetical protein CL1_0348 [Thermococcus cleftensis]
MGAIDAFVRTFSLMVEAKKLYIPALIFSLLLAPVAAYLLPSEPSFEITPNQTTSGDVIIEQYGGDVEGEIIDFLVQLGKALAILIAISAVLGSIVQYAITKGALLHESGEEYGIGELLLDGLKHLPGVIAIELIFMAVAIALASVALIPAVLGVLFLPWGAVLILIGVLLLLAILAITTSMTAIAIPLYADKGRIGAAFSAFGMVFGNVLSSIAFGVLLWVGVIGVSMIAGSVGFAVDLVFPEGIASYASELLQAPFNALMMEFLTVGGVAFYRELQKMEELKKVDEELLGLA